MGGGRSLGRWGVAETDSGEVVLNEIVFPEMAFVMGTPNRKGVALGQRLEKIAYISRIAG